MTASSRRAIRVAVSLAYLALEPAVARGGPSDAGDFIHTPAPEQRANTPLPIYVEYPAEPLGRVIVKYAATGVKTWSRLEMKRLGRGWGNLVPCGDVKAGTMRYWVQGFDVHGEAVASAGDPKNPFVVPIRDLIVSKPPHLPGRAAPPLCEGSQPTAGEASEPPDPKPTVPNGAPPHESERESERESEHESSSPAGEMPFARWWIGIAGTLDILSLPAGNDVCALSPSGVPTNPSAYYCTNPDGSDFPARTSLGGRQNAALVSGESGQVAGGVQAGDVRVMIAVDYAFGRSVLLGARLGYVLNAYPPGGAAVKDGRALGTPLHLEARGTYVFGDDPLAHAGFAPTGFASLGVSEVDAHTVGIVSYVVKSGQLPVRQPVNVWRTSGPFFIAAGGGARYQFSSRAAFTAAVRLNVALGQTLLLTYGPELQFQYGF